MSPVVSLDLSISNEIHWNELTEQQKAQGIDPFSLRYMKFTQDGASPSLNEVWRFFMGCKCASTNEAFTQAVSDLEDCPKEIQDLAVRISSIVTPQDPSTASPWSVSEALKRDYIRDYHKEYETFNGLYKKLLGEGKADLLHPARYSELRSYLEPHIPQTLPPIDLDFITQGFIIYRNFGYEQARLHSTEHERTMLQEGIRKVQEEANKIEASASATLPSDSEELEQLLESIVGGKHLFYLRHDDFMYDLYVDLYNQFKIACLAYEELRYLDWLDLVPNQETELSKAEKLLVQFNAEKQLVQFTAQKEVMDRVKITKQQDVAYIQYYPPDEWITGVDAIRRGLNEFKKYCFREEIKNLQFYLDKLNRRPEGFKSLSSTQNMGILSRIAQIFDLIPKEATEIPAEFTAENLLLV